MTLNEYLAKNKIKAKVFAKQIDVTEGYLSALRRHEKWPGKEVAQRIIEATNGKVTSDSFLKEVEDEKRV